MESVAISMTTRRTKITIGITATTLLVGAVALDQLRRDRLRQLHPFTASDDAYNAARLARGLTSRVYFGNEQGPSGVVAGGQMVIVHPDGSRERFACMKRVACEGCKVLVTKLVADSTCNADREQYR